MSHGESHVTAPTAAPWTGMMSGRPWVGVAAGLSIVALILVLAVPPTPAAANPGARAFSQCAVCHTLEKGRKSAVGPNLYGLFGRAAGTADGFVFSPALKASGIVWDAKTLDAYLASPTQVVPGTRMVQKMPDSAKRAALIAFLQSETRR